MLGSRQSGCWTRARCRCKESIGEVSESAEEARRPNRRYEGESYAGAITFGNRQVRRTNDAAKRCQFMRRTHLICLIPQLQSASLHEKVSDWISCADCKRWVHFACDGVSTTYEIAILTAAPYRCLQCLVVHYPACKRQKQPADEEQFLSFQLASSYLAVHWLEQFRRVDGPPVARFTPRRKRTQQHEVPLLVVRCFFAPRVRCICSWTLL
jgi:hypothetical protein